jgi:hypothetical protein
MLTETTSAYVLLGTGVIILTLGMMLFVMCVKYYNLLQTARRGNIELMDHKILVRKYDDMMKLYLDKERSLDVILRDYSSMLKFEAIEENQFVIDNMAIQSDLSDKILCIYEEIIHSRIPKEELTN